MPDDLPTAKQRLQDLLRDALTLVEGLPSAEAVQEATPAYRTHCQESESRFRIERYGNTRFWGLYEGGELLAVTVYRKGAEAVRERLQAQEARIEHLTRGQRGGEGDTPAFPAPGRAVARLLRERETGRKQRP